MQYIRMLFQFYSLLWSIVIGHHSFIEIKSQGRYHGIKTLLTVSLRTVTAQNIYTEICVKVEINDKSIPQTADPGHIVFRITICIYFDMRYS